MASHLLPTLLSTILYIDTAIRTVGSRDSSTGTSDHDRMQNHHSSNSVQLICTSPQGTLPQQSPPNRSHLSGAIQTGPSLAVPNTDADQGAEM